MAVVLGFSLIAGFLVSNFARNFIDDGHPIVTPINTFNQNAIKFYMAFLLPLVFILTFFAGLLLVLLIMIGHLPFGLDAIMLSFDLQIFVNESPREIQGF